jgi:hypothetical protein
MEMAERPWRVPCGPLTAWSPKVPQWIELVPPAMTEASTSRSLLRAWDVTESINGH